MNSTGMIIDGIAASEAIDSSGEVLDVAGCDITDLEKGVAVLNWEHKDEKQPSHTALDIVGKIIFAKKIFKREDCENERQRDYWDKVKLPYIYMQARLFDQVGHKAAEAVAAMFRDAEANNEPVIVRYSIEGATLDKKGNRLVKSVARRVAATIKPCNRSCASGIVYDPRTGKDTTTKESKTKEVDDSLADLIATEKSEHPGLSRLGGHEYEYSPMNKTLTAGTTSSAPGSLVGGAALQKEHLEKAKQDAVKVVSALKKWDRKTPMKQYLKNELPDVDPDFIEKFTDMASDYNLKKNATAVASHVDPERAAIEDAALNAQNSKANIDFPPSPAAKAKKQKIVVMTPEQKLRFKKVRGSRPVPQTPGESYFDEGTGTLHTNMGSFKMHIPNDSHYEKILNSPEVQHHHDEAMKHWQNLNRLLRAGKLPPEVVMHAALFSGMSPMTPVPQQEFAFSHLRSMQDNSGLDPTQASGVTEEHRKEFARRVGKGTATTPEYMHDYWEGPGGDAVRTKGSRQLDFLEPNKSQYAGALNIGQKWNSVAAYHKLHKPLLDLISKYGADGRGIARALLESKYQAGLKNPDPNKYITDVDGFAPKTTSYLLAMLGAGNIHVPDTHYIRHTFGLPTDDKFMSDIEKQRGGFREGEKQKEVPFAPNEHIKSVLWDAGNHHIGEAMDRYYFNNHPAVKYTTNRFFGGQPNEQAIFPSFWAHWLSVAPHERALGIPNDSQNAGTDHRVYWNTVNQVLKDYGLEHQPLIYKNDSTSAQEPLLARTAAAHHAIAEKFGEGPGLFFFYRHLAPHLLAEHQRNSITTVPPEMQVVKMEKHLVNLRKAAEAVAADPKGGAAETVAQHGLKDAPKGHVHDFPVVQYGNLNIKPGQVYIHSTKGAGHYAYMGDIERDGKKFAVLHDADNVMTGKLKAEHAHVLPHDVIKSHADIMSMPQGVREHSIIDSKKHGVAHLMMTPEQHELIHGTNLDDWTKRRDNDNAKSGVNDGNSHWRVMPTGKLAYIKEGNKDYREYGAYDAHREGMYANLARDVFGLGEHVPTVAVFNHPKTGHPHSVMQAVESAQHYNMGDSEHRQALIDNFRNGTSQKLFLMNQILSNGDRHRGNWIFQRDLKHGKHQIRLIDNGLSMENNDWDSTPADYVSSLDNIRLPTGKIDWRNAPVHPEAVDWLKGIDEQKLQSMMGSMQVHPDVQDATLKKVKAMKSYLDRAAADGYTPTLGTLPEAVKLGYADAG